MLFEEYNVRFFRSWFGNNSLEYSSRLLPEGVSQPTEINHTTVITFAPTEKYDCLKSDGDVDNNLLANKIIATIFIPKNYEGDTAEFPEIWRDSEKANRPALNQNTNYDFLYALI